MMLVPVIMVDEPTHRDESIVHPVELEEDSEEEGNRRVNQNRIERSTESWRVFEQCEVDGEAEI